MFAVLGDIEFELITYWDGFEATFGVDYVEHARIEGKPGLQFVGDKLDEIQISLVFHQHYCVPDVELARLRTAMKAHQALALVFGNGDYRGWFVITDQRTDGQHRQCAGRQRHCISAGVYRRSEEPAEATSNTHAGSWRRCDFGRRSFTFRGGAVRPRRRQLCQTGAVRSPDHHQCRSGGAENEG